MADCLMTHTISIFVYKPLTAQVSINQIWILPVMGYITNLLSLLLTITALLTPVTNPITTGFI